MSHSPGTFGGEPTPLPGTSWEDLAELHRAGDSGVLSGLKAVNHGTLAALVRQVALMAEAERANYVIARNGDHRLDVDEIMALYARPDFPHA